MEYNTARNYLSMREYGRHIQKMVEHLLQLPDKEDRQQQTKLVIELMGFFKSAFEECRRFPPHVVGSSVFHQRF